ncbi:MAG TPA: hypothetical protein PKW80_14965 [Bacteroidales bacterium]|nr:hypothetical protein [Bacteroidales bacterium]
MKKISGFLFAFFIFGNLFAQNIYKADARLADCMSQEYITQLENSGSELIPYYNFYLDHSYYVVGLNATEKEITGQDIHTVTQQTDHAAMNIYFKETTYSQEKFNPLKYNFNLSANSFTTYIWKEAGIALIFYPLSHISADFKEFMKQNK